MKEENWEVTTHTATEGEERLYLRMMASKYTIEILRVLGDMARCGVIVKHVQGPG